MSSPEWCWWSLACSTAAYHQCYIECSYPFVHLHVILYSTCWQVKGAACSILVIKHGSIVLYLNNHDDIVSMCTNASHITFAKWAHQTKMVIVQTMVNWITLSRGQNHNNCIGKHREQLNSKSNITGVGGIIVLREGSWDHNTTFGFTLCVLLVSQPLPLYHYTA